jgi:hypothetical protein
MGEEGVKVANLRIEAPMVDGSLMPYVDEEDSCFRAIEVFCGDDLRPPVRCLKISVRTENGHSVVFTIPNDKTGMARVTMDGESI